MVTALGLFSFLNCIESECNAMRCDARQLFVNFGRKNMIRVNLRALSAVRGCAGKMQMFFESNLIPYNLADINVEGAINQVSMRRAAGV